MATTLYVGVGADKYQTIQAAVDAANDGDIIIIDGGTYDEDVILSGKNTDGTPTVTVPKALTIKAADGETVTCTGTFQVGTYVKGTTILSDWNKDLVIENLVFDPVDNGNSLEFQNATGQITVKECKFVAEADTDDFFINRGTGWIVGEVDFDTCEFTGGRITPTTGVGGLPMSFDDCTFTDVKINLANGYNYKFADCTFNYKFAKDALTYAIRSNGSQAVEITGGTFNIDVAEDFVAEESDFGVLWARENGDAKWNVDGTTINYTEKALAAAEKDDNFTLVWNATPSDEKAVDRITINNTSVKSEDVVLDDLSKVMGTDSGVVNITKTDEENGVMLKTVYDDGVQGETKVLGTDDTIKAIVVNGNDRKGYAGIEEAKAAIKELGIAATATVIIPQGVTVSAGVFDNIIDNQDAYWGPVSPADNAVAMQIDGTVDASTAVVINNKKVVISETGVVDGGEHFTATGAGAEVVINGDVNTSELRVAAGAKITVKDDAEVDRITVGYSDWESAEDQPSQIIFDGAKVTYRGYGDSFVTVVNVLAGNTLSVINGSVIDDAEDDYKMNIDLAENAELKLDVDSSIKADSISGSGKIIIDAKDLSGSCKVLDLSMTSGLDVAVEFENLSSTAKYNIGEDGDIVLYDVSTATIYVNESWNGSDDFDNLGDGKVFGVNAFADLGSAGKNFAPGSTIKIIDSEIAGKAEADANKITLGQAGEYTITGNGDAETGTAGTYVGELSRLEIDTAKLAENERIVLNLENINATAFKFTEEGAVVDGTEYKNGKYDLNITDSIISGKDYVDSYGWFTFYGDSNVTVTNSIFGFKADSDISKMPVGAKGADGTKLFTQAAGPYSGVAIGIGNKFTLKDSTASFAYIVEIGEKTDISLDNSILLIDCLYSGTYYWGSGDVKNASIKLTNGSILKQSTQSGSGSDVAATAYIFNLSNYKVDVTVNESSFIWDFGTVKLDKKSSIEVTTGYFEADVLSITDGTFTVGGTSTLDIGSVTGDGSIVALNGTTLKSSTVGGSLVLGDREKEYIDAEVKFQGDNEFSSVAAYFGDKVVVEEGASLTVGRQTVGYGAAWDINGTVENAKEITAEQKADLAATFTAEKGLSLTTTGGTTVFDVDNAYVVFGSGSATSSKNYDNNGGEFKITFDNSIIDAEKVFAIYTPLDNVTNAPKFTVDITDSVFNAKNNFHNASKYSTMTLDNSNLTVASNMRNDGVLNVNNGSEVIVKGNSDGYGFGNTGNRGSINVTGAEDKVSSFDITNGTDTAPNALRNSGSISVNENGVFKAGYLKNNTINRFFITSPESGGNAKVIVKDAEGNIVNETSYSVTTTTTAFDMELDLVAGAYTYEIVLNDQVLGKGELNIVPGSFNLNDGGKAEISNFTNYGSISMEQDSKLVVNKAFDNKGSLNVAVDDAEWQGVQKVVDAAADATVDYGTVNVTGAEKHIENGDLYIYNVDMSTVYVNSDWDKDIDSETEGVQNYEFGYKLADGQFYRINAFGSCDDMKLAADTTDIVLTAGNEVSYGKLGVQQDVTLSSEGEGFAKIGTFDDDSIDKTIISGEGIANTVTIAAGSKIEVTGDTVLRPEDTLLVNGELTFAKGVTIYAKSTITVDSTGVLTFNTGRFQNTVNPLTVYGKFVVNYNADDNWFPKFAGNENRAEGTLIIDGSKGAGVAILNTPVFTLGGGYKAGGYGMDAKALLEIKNGGSLTTNAIDFWNGKNSVITVTGDSSLIFGAIEGGTDWANTDVAGMNYDYFKRTLYNEGSISATGSTIDMTGRNFENEGSVEINGSNFTAGKVTTAEDGSFKITGASNVNSEFTGALELAGATLTGKITGEAEAVVSKSSITGEDTAVTVKSLELKSHASLNGGAELNAGSMTGKSFLSVSGEGTSLTADSCKVELTVKNQAAATLGEYEGRLTVESTAGDTEITGNATLKANSAVSGTVNVGGDATLNSNAAVSGTLNVGGNATLDSNAAVSGTLNVGGNATLNSNVKLSGKVDVKETIKNTGSVTATGAEITAKEWDLSGDLNLKDEAKVKVEKFANSKPASINVNNSTLEVSTFELTKNASAGCSITFNQSKFIADSVSYDGFSTNKFKFSNSEVEVGTFTSYAPVVIESSKFTANEFGSDYKNATSLRLSSLQNWESMNDLAGQTGILTLKNADGKIVATREFVIPETVDGGTAIQIYDWKDVNGNLVNGTFANWDVTIGETVFEPISSGALSVKCPNFYAAVSGDTLFDVEKVSGEVQLGSGNITFDANGGNYALVDGSTITLKGTLNAGDGMIYNDVNRYGSAYDDVDAAEGTTLNIDGDVQAHALYVSMNSAVNVKADATLQASRPDGKEGNLNVYGGTFTVEKGGFATTANNNITGNSVIKGTFEAGAIAIAQGAEGQKSGNLLVDGGTVNMFNGSILVGTDDFSAKYFSEAKTDADKVATLTLANGAVVNLSDDDDVASGLKVANGALVDIKGSTLNIGETSAVGTLDNAGTVKIDASTVSADIVTNSGAITVSGASTLNITSFSGNAITVSDKAVLSGNFAADIKVEGTVKLADTANFAGTVNGTTLSIGKAYDGKLVVNGGDATILVANGAKFLDDSFTNVTLKGDSKKAVITAKDSALNNVVIESAKLAIEGGVEDGMIAADIAITGIASIDGKAIQLVNGMYLYTDANGVSYQLTEVEGGIKVTKLSIDPEEDDDVTVDDLSTQDINKKTIDFKPVSGSTTVNWSGVDLETQAGSTTTKFASGKAGKKGASDTVIDYTIGNISKDAEGGTNNVSVGNYANVDVLFGIDRAGSLSVGKESSLTVGEDINGTSAKQSIKIGDNSEFKAGNIDLAGGSNSVKLGKDAGFTAKDVENVKSFSAGKNATVNVDDYLAPEVSNTITLSDGAKMTVDGDIVTACGDNVVRDADGNVTDFAAGSIGTTVKLGKAAELTVDDVIGLAKLSTGTGAKVEASGDIYGTEKGNSISIGSKGTFNAEDINLYAGSDSLKLGSDSNAEIKSIASVETISIGARSDVKVNGAIANVSKISASSGKNGDLTTVNVAGKIDGTDGKNSVSFGNWSNVTFNAGLDLEGGSDTFKVGSDSIVDINGNIDNVETVSFGARTEADVDGNINGVNKLTVSSGSYDKKKKVTTWTEVEAGDIAGTTGSNSISIGSRADVTFGDVNLFDGNDTVKIGDYSKVNMGTLDFGTNANGKTDKDALTLGKGVELFVEDIEAVSSIKVGKNVVITDTNGGGFDFDGVSGNWKNAQLITKETLDLGTTETGSLYANEWAEFDFSITDGQVFSLEIEGENTVIELYQGDNYIATYEHPLDLQRANLDGAYTLRVSVDGADLNKKDDSNNKYAFKVTIA